MEFAMRKPLIAAALLVALAAPGWAQAPLPSPCAA